MIRAGTSKLRESQAHQELPGLQIGKSGQIFVADKSAKCVFRLNGDGDVSLPVAGLSDIQRIQIDAEENLYVLTSNSREAQIEMVNPIGQSTVLHKLTFAATTFVRDIIGQFVVVSQDTHRIVLITTERDITELTRIYPPVSDLVLNESGPASHHQSDEPFSHSLPSLRSSDRHNLPQGC